MTGEIVGAALAVDFQLFDGVEDDRRQGIHLHRAGADGGRRAVVDRVGAGGAVDDQRVAGGGIAAVDGDVGQRGRRIRIVEIDFVAAVVRALITKCVLLVNS